MSDLNPVSSIRRQAIGREVECGAAGSSDTKSDEPHPVDLWEVPLRVESSSIVELETLLSADEQDRAGRFRFEKDRREFVVARGSLRKILSHYASGSPADWRFGYGVYGKPGLLNGGESGGLRFNVSHSSGLALIAVTREREVGVDVEWVDRGVEMDSIATRFFNEEENAMLQGSSASERARIFFGIWTRKEALAKARGVGIGVELERMEVPDPSDDLDFAPGIPVLRSDHPYYVADLECTDGYAGAIALEGAPALASWRRSCP